MDVDDAINRVTFWDMHARVLAAHGRVLHVPCIGGSPPDLYVLYFEVAMRGGRAEVTRTKQWTQVANSLGVPASLRNRSYQIKRLHVNMLLDEVGQLAPLQRLLPQPPSPQTLLPEQQQQQLGLFFSMAALATAVAGDAGAEAPTAATTSACAAAPATVGDYCAPDPVFDGLAALAAVAADLSSLDCPTSPQAATASAPAARQPSTKRPRSGKVACGKTAQSPDAGDGIDPECRGSADADATPTVAGLQEPQRMQQRSMQRHQAHAAVQQPSKRVRARQQQQQQQLPNASAVTGLPRSLPAGALPADGAVGYPAWYPGWAMAWATDWGLTACTNPLTLATIAAPVAAPARPIPQRTHKGPKSKVNALSVGQENKAPCAPTATGPQLCAGSCGACNSPASLSPAPSLRVPMVSAWRVSDSAPAVAPPTWPRSAPSSPLDATAALGGEEAGAGGNSAQPIGATDGQQAHKVMPSNHHKTPLGPDASATPSAPSSESPPATCAEAMPSEPPSPTSAAGAAATLDVLGDGIFDSFHALQGQLMPFDHWAGLLPAVDAETSPSLPAPMPRVAPSPPPSPASAFPFPVPSQPSAPPAAAERSPRHLSGASLFSPGRLADPTPPLHTTPVPGADAGSLHVLFASPGAGSSPFSLASLANMVLGFRDVPATVTAALAL